MFVFHVIATQQTLIGHDFDISWRHEPKYCFKFHELLYRCKIL